MFELIAGVVLEGLKVFGEERRTRFSDDHHDLIEALRKAENEGIDSYTDIDVDLLEEKIYDFLKVYHKELKEFNNEKS